MLYRLITSSSVTPSALSSKMQCRQEADRRRSVVVELPLDDDGAFDLEKSVCSHGLFMMAPNRWDPLSKTLERPLRLYDDDHEHSLLVRISQSSDSPHCLLLHVFGTDSLSTLHQRSLLGQVRRMLRLSVEENKRVKEFQDICEEAKERGFGRVFRSPTLFEDMVKCMLLCNCQWSRTLTMAEALCELQLELNCPSSAACFSVADNRNQLKGVTAAESEHFTPKTPAGKESRKRAGAYGCSRNLLERLTAVEEIFVDEEKPDVSVRLAFPDGKEVVLQKSDLCQATAEVCEVSTSEPFNSDPSEDGELSFNKLGNFPSPKELAGLDESFLAKRCGLGYRAGRIIKLAKGIVEGRIQLKELEEACSNPSLSDYDKMAEQLREIDGFGPFTCANVLMCLGYYHVIPTDSETVRHLKQVHAKTSTTIKTVQTDVEKIYGKYEPFQFLAYWSEVWHFYDEWFGKLSEMPHSQYKLITAANMRPKRNVKCKKLKITSAEKLGM